MNKLKIISAAIAFTLLAFSARSAQYYVVIGAFAKETNARKYTGYARNLYLKAYYTFNTERNLYYVHVMKTPQKEKARNLTLYLKHETGFKDAWVFTELFAPALAMSSMNETNKNPHPRYSGNSNFLLTAKEASASQNSSEKIYSREYSVASAAGTWTDWTNIDEVSYISDIKDIPSAREHLDLASEKLFTFIVETPELKTISAEIMLVNYERARKLFSFNTGEFVALRGKKKNQTITVVCDVFGYSQATRTLNLDKLSSMGDIIQNAEGVWEVRFKLERLAENEISVMYNTTFYSNATVLEPSSKKQMDELLFLMKSQSEYRILIHSHCNKGLKRDVKLPGKSKNYFDIRDPIVKKSSDRQLTKGRAEIIRAYLMDNGIAGKRIAVLGWGSLDMLVSPTSSDARINDRIEIELLEN